MDLKPCPFCGHSADIVPAIPPEWHSGAKHVKIQCSNEFCFLHDHDIILLTACIEEYCNTLRFCIARWNERRRKVKTV